MHNRKKTLKDGWGIRPFLLVNSFLPPQITEKLSKYGEVLPLPPFEKLPFPLQSHPDILTFYHKDSRTLFLYGAYYEEHRDLFDKLPVSIVAIEEEPGTYPMDIRLDALVLGDSLLCKKSHTSRALLSFYKGKTVNVKQGYARCSALVYKDKVLTEDTTIEKAAVAMGKSVWKLPPMGILLPPYDCGFIGGASAVIGEQILFFGTLSKHPEEKEIRAFLGSSSVVEFSHQPLTDYGSLTLIS